jgi:hypothetical protein
MDPLAAIGAVIGVLTFAGTIFGAVKAYGAMQQKVNDQDDEIAAISARLDRAEVQVAQTAKLTDAVETMGDKFAAELKHLAEVWGLNHQHVQSQLGEIKEQIRKGKP